MRRTANAIALLLLTAFLPQTQSSPARFKLRPPQDDSLEITREDRFFLHAIYDRIDDLLTKERNQYDVPYVRIRIREHQIKEQLDETLKRREEVQNQLDLQKSQEQKLRKAINKAGTPEERVKLLKRLESVETERKKAEDEANTLSEKKAALNDSLRVHRVMHFAEAKDLKAQIDRIEKRKMELWDKLRDWKTHNNHKSYIAFRNYLMKTATSMGLTCNVSIQSERDSVETQGATIKYQTPEQRQFKITYTAKCLTACAEQMKPNKYYIWIERGSKPISDPEQLYWISGENQTVRLQESPRP